SHFERTRKREALNVRHFGAGGDHAGALLGEPLERFLPVGRDVDRVALVGENGAQARSDGLLVVGNQNFGVCVLHAISVTLDHLGKVMDNLEPSRRTSMPSADASESTAGATDGDMSPPRHSQQSTAASVPGAALHSTSDDASTAAMNAAAMTRRATSASADVDPTASTTPCISTCLSSARAAAPTSASTFRTA